MFSRLLNAAWRWKCEGEAARFRKAITGVEQTQRDLLISMLHANGNTVFGRAHGFPSISSAREFQQRVPLTTYEDYEPYMARIADGEPKVLTRERVLLLEPTSGTTSAEKLIPYTRELRRQFQRGIAAWIADLFVHRPRACRGRAYWSISPMLGSPRRTPGGISIGFDNDAAYLGRLEQWLLRQLLVVPDGVARLGNVPDARYATLLYLVAASDLSLISVWNPTFLTALVAPLRDWGERLVRDLRDGTLSLPQASAGKRSLSLRRNPQRAGELASLLRGSLTDAELHAALWPQLALISCWTDAAARYFLPALADVFPHVEIQPKGLLATEGFVSLPFVGSGAALAVRSHFFEFAEPGDSNRCRLAHELERGERYQVVLTTGGGLYRYNLGDEVEVIGFLGECPLLRFCGKSSVVSDLVGEKLSDVQVQSAIREILAQLNVRPGFLLLAPVLGSPPRYRLYLQGIDQEVSSQLADRLQRSLEANPYYRHAIQFAQLGPVEVSLLSDNVPGWTLYERQCLARGQKAGNIKPALFDRWTGWQDIFTPGTETASERDVAGKT